MQWLNTLLQGILLGGLYALYGAGLALIFGVMRQVNLAHGDFITLAAYAALVIVPMLGGSPLLTLFLVIPLMFLFGFLLQRGLLNATVGKGPLPSLLLTFGLSVIIQNVLQLIFTADNQGLDAGGLETQSIQLSDGVSLGIMPLITFVLAVSILWGLQLFFQYTSLGQAFRATSDDPATAELMGINSGQIYAIAMGISLAIVGVAGILLGIRTNFAPADGPARLIFAFEAVIIGGLGSIWGTLAGGVILGMAQGIGAQINPTWFQLAGHVVTLLVLAIKPTGLFARTRES